MTVLRFPSVLIVGSRNRDLEVALAGCGMRLASVPISELATLAHPAARVPQILVVDLRDAKQLPPQIAVLKRNHPNTAILLVTSGLDATLMLDAMRAGVTECVAEPLSETELEAALVRLSEQVEAPEGGQVFAVIGAKGGIGTTTLAVNLATELAMTAPDQTLLVDLHLSHGDAALLLGVEPRFTVNDALENTHRMDERFLRGLVTPTKAGPNLLASSDRPVGETGRADRVKMLIEFASRLYRYVVLDVSRADALCLDALDAATRIVLLSNQELPTIRSTTRMVQMLQQRYGKERISVIVSRFDKQNDIAQHDIERVVGLPVSHVLPSDYRLALRAMNQGRPLALDNHNKLAAAYREVARDLAGLESGRATNTTSGGLFSRLTGRRQ